MDKLIMKAQKLADENRSKFFCVMQKGKRRIVCDQGETLIRGQKQWSIIYGCQYTFLGELITISPTSYELIIQSGWYRESKNQQPLDGKGRKKKSGLNFSGWQIKGEWYHPDGPPQWVDDMIIQGLIDSVKEDGLPPTKGDTISPFPMPSCQTGNTTKR